METLAEYWIEHDNAQWHKALNTHECDGELYDSEGLERRNEDRSLVRCDREILKDDRYLDTNFELGAASSTLKLCERCANQLTQKL